MALFLLGYFVSVCRSCLKRLNYPLYLVCKGDNMLKMDLEFNKGILFVRLKGKLLRKNSYKINNYLNPVLKKHCIKYLVYNFSFLEDIDTSGLDAIISSKYIIKNNRGKIRMCEVNGKIKEKIKGARLARITNELAAFRLLEVA